MESRSIPAHEPSRLRSATGAIALASLVLASPAGAVIRFDTTMLSQVAGSSSMTWMSTIATGDLNGDGIPDVVVNSPNYFARVEVLLGRGDGSFEAPIVFGSDDAIGIGIGDFDGDGHPDIVTDGYQSGPTVYFGDGTGHHWDLVSLPMIDVGMACVVGDFDGDGRPDFVIPTYVYGGDFPHYLRAFLSRPGRAFEVVTTPADSIQRVVWDVRVGDFNRDGRPDLVMTTSSITTGGLLIALGRGDGTFALRTVDHDVWSPRNGVDVADFDGDGNADIAWTFGSAVRLYRGLGDGTFEAPRIAPVDATTLAVRAGDFNRDGLPDLAVTETGTGVLEVRPGLGGWAFGPALVSHVSRDLGPIEALDLDGDERIDLAGLDTQGSGLMIALGDGQGGFGSASSRLVFPAGAADVDAGDFNGDGHADAVIAWSLGDSSKVMVAPGGTGRRLAPGPAITVPGNVSRVIAADIDGDGALDAVLLFGSLQVEWTRGRGDGTFEGVFPIPLPAGDALMDVRDVTGDGLPDLLCSSSQFHVYPNRGGGAFGPPIEIPTYFTPFRVAVGDLNGDSRPDVAIASGSEVIVAYGRADGGFDLGGTSAVQEMIGVAIADVNGDGRDDLVYIDGPEAIPSSEPMPNWLGVQLQRPDGTLDTPTLSPWPNHGFAIVSVSDIDGDRHADVVYNTNPGFGVALGDGRGNFAMEGQYDGTNDPARGVPRLLDFDGDGRPDLLFASDWLGVNTGVTVAFGRDPVPPHVTLTAPTPLLAIGAGTTLSWTVSDNVGIHDAEAFVSRHGLQGPFRSIGRVAGADEAMDWTVTGPPSDSVAFKIVVRDSAGNVGWDRGHTLGSIAQLPTGVTDASLPKRLALHLAGANPVHERLALRMELPRAGRARLALYDLQGRKVASLLDEDRPAGVSTSEFDLSSRGPGLRAGLYFLRLESSRERALARVALVP